MDRSGFEEDGRTFVAIHNPPLQLIHDSKLDDPALERNIFYIGVLGSKRTHAGGCGTRGLATRG
jgi:xanthine/CO dehydrogenase XdhC/CoxF family maturation factor